MRSGDEDNVSIMFWWFVSNVLVMFWLCVGDVLVMFQGRFCDVFGTRWSCFNDVWQCSGDVLMMLY